jgi:hypothetical protein
MDEIKRLSSMRKEEIMKALRTRGCPLCDLMSQALSDFLADFQYKLANEEQAQLTHASELGFCPFHTWQLASVSSPQGVSSGYRRLLEHISEQLSKISKNATNLPNAILGLVQDSKGCRVCCFVRETEVICVHHFAAVLEEREGREAYAAKSQGFCLRHLGLMVAAASGTSVSHFLISETARRFHEISEDMKVYAVKHYSIPRGHFTPDEKDAYIRALIHIAGVKIISTPKDII